MLSTAFLHSPVRVNVVYSIEINVGGVKVNITNPYF